MRRSAVLCCILALLAADRTQARAQTAPPAAVPFALTRTTVTVAPRQVAAIGVSGAQGAVGVRVSGGAVTARYDAATASVIVTGIALGTATVAVGDAADDAASIAVTVLPAAGTVPAEVSVALGGIVSPQFALARAQAAIARAAQLVPGGAVGLRGVTIAASLQPGDVLEATAQVTLGAGAAYADQSGTTSVHLRVESLAALEPAFLFYSDDPERLGTGDDGVAYRSTIDVARSARIYAYHVSDTPARRLYLVLRTAGAASVQILGYAAGPADAYGYVGHVSTLQYLLERHSGESVLADVSAAAQFVMPLGYRALEPGELVAAIYDLRVLSGDAVDVAVVSATGTDDPLVRALGAELPSDGHGRRGEFALASVPPLALTYAAGAPDPPPFTVGDPTLENLRPGGRALGGDYGALRAVTLVATNPKATAQNVYFYEAALAGTATTTIWFADDARPTEIPCVKLPSRYLVRTIALQPGESRTLAGEYMTDGSSSFPLDFGLTSTPPSPPPGPYSPDACNPKTPPASPSPAPSESPTPGT